MMTLLLTGTRDEALLALVIKNAVEVAKANDTYVGRTAIQKVMYYLKMRGVDMTYKFDIHHYGPYCQDIVNDIDWLLADNVVVDTSKNPEKYSNYAPAQSMDELIGLQSDALKDDEVLIRETVEALLPLDPNQLELTATLDYLYRAEIAKGTKTNIKANVVDRFIEIKKDKFDRPQVETMYDIVVRMSEVA